MHALCAEGAAALPFPVGSSLVNTIKQDASVILVVDNDPLMMTAVAAALHLSGYEAHCARNEESALKAARGLILDLVICDLDLQGDNGVELWQEIQQEPHMVDTPVIFVSESPSSDILERVQAAGGSYYLRKPYDPNVLLELVDKALWMPHLVNSHIQASTAASKLKGPSSSVRSQPAEREARQSM